MKKTIDKTLVGQLVVMYEPSLPVERAEQTVRVYSVTDVGRKYIKAGGYRFDKETLRCPDLNRRLFIGSPEEFSQIIRTKTRALLLMDKVRSNLEDCTLQELQALIDALECISAEKNDR